MPDPASNALGWLRIGARIRLKLNPTPTPTCSTGWYAIHPRGFACAGEGVTVGTSPPPAPVAVAPRLDGSVLPYDYYLVKEQSVPEYHRPPSRDDQRAAQAFGERYAGLLAEDPDQAARFLLGELEGEPPKPPVVNRLLDHGFFVAGTGLEERASRQFVRNSRGRYVKLAQLEPRSGAGFHGVELGAGRTLPVAWVTRAARPLIRSSGAGGRVRWTEDAASPALDRLTVLDAWRSREKIGNTHVHVLEGGRYLRDWFVAVARPIARPREVPRELPWVHVNLAAQTLVVYRGDAPVYATLVSTGLEEHATPTGVFPIRRKYIAATMAAIGADAADDRYRIEDVPWTQYFSGSIALHGAFWHARFGQTRSHGCVNIAPEDARRIFGLTLPELPEGWFGVSTEGTDILASYVVVTEQ